LRPRWDPDAQPSTVQADPAFGGDDELAWSRDALDVLRGERALACSILAATVSYRARGRTLIEGATVDAHKRDYEATPAVLEALALRQFLADASFTGSGKTNPERRWAFRQRDAIVFELVVLGYPLERISEAVGISTTRLYNLPAVRTARKVFQANQRGLVLHWHERGYSTTQIARALGLPLRTVQRIVKKGWSGKPELSLADSMEVIRLAAMYAQVLERMELFPERAPPPERPPSLEELREGIPIDYFERVPPGLPLYVEAEPYHSYVPGVQEELGAPAGDPRSGGVLHPFLHALLARSPHRPLSASCPESRPRVAPDGSQAIVTGAGCLTGI
jgi:hypothetical protein